MITVPLSNYSDDKGNTIEFHGTTEANSSVTFRGRNNKIVIDPETNIASLSVSMECDNGALTIGPSRFKFSARIRIGQDSSVAIGRNVSSTGPVDISACEGTEVSIGNNCMIALEVRIRADDGHPILM